MWHDLAQSNDLECTKDTVNGVSYYYIISILILYYRREYIKYSLFAQEIKYSLFAQEIRCSEGLKGNWLFSREASSDSAIGCCVYIRKEFKGDQETDRAASRADLYPAW
jgi:hypothetical protein